MNAGSSGTTSSPVIAARLILLLLVSVATVWAFAFSGARDRAASGAGESVHVHGAGALSTAELDQAADDSEQDVHAHHGATEHDQAANGIAKSSPRGRRRARGAAERAAGGTGPAASPAIAVDDQAHTRLIGSAEVRSFVLSVRAAAWLDSKDQVTAVLRKDELSGLIPGEPGRFTAATAPAASIGVRLSAEPPTPWDESTSQVRFHVDAGAAGLEPGEVGWVEFAARPRELLVIPAKAVLYSPEGPYVLAKADGRSFSTRRIEIGRVYRGVAVVLSGLRDGEPIVVGSPFSWNAEQRLQRQHEAGAPP